MTVPKRWCSVVVGGWCSLSCAGAPSPCSAPSCGGEYECLANTCMPAGADPVPKDTTRIVLEPIAVATATASETVADSVTLGQDGAAGLYLRFASTWKREGSIVRAFLLLEPVVGSIAPSEDLPLDVWTVESPWSQARVATGVRPKLGAPRARGLLRSSPPATARIDVTRLATTLAEKGDDDGVAVLAGAKRERGVSVRSGCAGGAPRLEIYVRAAR